MPCHPLETNQKKPARQAAAGRAKGQTAKLQRYTTKNKIAAHRSGLCYVFSSCLRNAGVGLGQFWPVFLPVSRAQFLPRYDACRELLDGVTVLCGDGFLAAAHLRHERGRHLNGFR